MKPKIIVLEGPDGLGKTSLAQSLAAEYFNNEAGYGRPVSAPILNSPSRTNTVKFLRGVTRGEEPWRGSLNAFERQCLHTMSNLVDFYEEFRGGRNLVLDRCHLSTLVYGLADGADKLWMEVLMDVHHKVAGRFADQYDVDIIVLDRDERFNAPDKSYHEAAIKWTDLRDLYRTFPRWCADGFYLFRPDERRHVIEVGTKTPEDVFQEAVRLIDET
jgi:GTPase SAR1 family protein